MSRPCNRRSARRRTGLAGLAALWAAAALGTAAAPPPLPPAAGLRLPAGDLARAAAGEVVVRIEPAPRGGPRQGLGVGTVDAPPARVFAALADFAHWSEFMPFMRRSDARREPDGAVVCTQSLALPTGERHYQVRARARAEGSGEAAVRRVSWGYVAGSGNIAAQRGSWTLLPYAGGRTLAVLRLASDPGGAASWLADRATAKSIPWIFNGLRQQVGRERYAAAGGPGSSP
jgi:hypothetical protein